MIEHKDSDDGGCILALGLPEAALLFPIVNFHSRLTLTIPVSLLSFSTWTTHILTTVPI